jgi:DNA-binding response OmpR family regulator
LKRRKETWIVHEDKIDFINKKSIATVIGLRIALKEHPDLILLDILMPEKDGMGMLKDLRRDDWGKNVPVIVLSNLNDPPRVAEALRNGVYDFLVKSECNLAKVLNKVKTRLPFPL